ncbi:MAG: hypothetical protein ACK4OM_07120 [Alphaproteobacteria bacterium]
MLTIPTVQVDSNIVLECNKWLESYLGYNPNIESQKTEFTNRETISFGYDYFKLTEGNNSFTNIPTI